MRTVVIVAFERSLVLDVVGPADVFAMANRLSRGQGPNYQIEVLSWKGGKVTTSSGLGIHTGAAKDFSLDIDTLIVAGGSIEQISSDDDLVCWIRKVAGSCRRVCSVCTGAFALAAAGLLNGRRAATHWDSGPAFTARFPDVHLDLRPIYIRDGRFWTSAGATAGIDLALALVEKDLGKAAALAIAKQLVVFLQRPGDQAQFSSTLSAQSKALNEDPANRFGDLHAWMADNLTADLSVEALARRSNMTPRSFARTYALVMKVTPAKAVEQVRVEAAKQALERGEVSIKRLAETVGFGDEERLRRAFNRALGVSPNDYRARFSTGGWPNDQTEKPFELAA